MFKEINKLDKTRASEKAARALMEKIDPKDRPEVERCILFAARKHQGQFRKTGEPYITHPIEVATIIAEEGLDVSSVLAAICHDLVEDSDTNREELVENFGEEVAFLVDGVTKISDVAKAGEEGRVPMANFQKFIIAVSRDPRVLIIKLADRVHNLRTIRVLGKKRQKAIAIETIDGYAPLAHRIGMKKIQNELEDRSLEIVDRDAYTKAGLIIEEAKKAGKQDIDSAISQIEIALAEFGLDQVRVKSRIKSRFSVAEKMKRYKSGQAIEDIIGIRLITKSISECYLALGAIHLQFPPKEESFDDYIAKPRANLYQSLHSSVRVPTESGQQLIEVQIRTEEMDDVAERGLAAHWRYKHSIRDEKIDQSLGQMSDLVKSDEDIDELFGALKNDFFQDEIYCFTPAGDVRILPKNSTAVDFAYSIHSDLGDQIAGARVNQELYPITKPLPNEAVIEVIKSNKRSPSEDWLKSVKTGKARQRIKAARSRVITKNEKSALNTLREELKEAGHRRESSLPERDLLFFIKDIRQGIEIEDLLKDLKSSRFREEVIKSIPKKEAAPPQKRREATPKILIEGQDQIEYDVARCCIPEPGDDIVGYISFNREKGTVIHKKTCPNTSNIDPDRLVKAEYVESGEEIFESRIKIKFKDRPELLNDIATTVYSCGSEIVDIQLSSRYGIVSGEILCRVIGSSEQIKQSLEQVDGFLKLEN